MLFIIDTFSVFSFFLSSRLFKIAFAPLDLCLEAGFEAEAVLLLAASAKTVMPSLLVVYGSGMFCFKAVLLWP